MTVKPIHSDPHPFLQEPKLPYLLRSLPSLPLGIIFSKCGEQEFFAVARSERCMLQRSITANLDQKKFELDAFKTWLLAALKAKQIAAKSVQADENDKSQHTDNDDDELASAVHSLAFEGNPRTFKEYHRTMQRLFAQLHCLTAEHIDLTNIEQLTPDHLGYSFFIGPRMLQGLNSPVNAWYHSGVNVCYDMVRTGNIAHAFTFARYFRPKSIGVLYQACRELERSSYIDDSIAILEMIKYSHKSTPRMAGMLKGTLVFQPVQQLIVDLFRHTLESRIELLSFVKMMEKNRKNKPTAWPAIRKNREGQFLIYGLKRYGHHLIKLYFGLWIQFTNINNYEEPLQSSLFYHLFQCPVFSNDYKKLVLGIMELAKIIPQTNIQQFIELFFDRHREVEKIKYFIEQTFEAFPPMIPILLNALKKQTSKEFVNQLLGTVVDLHTRSKQWNVVFIFLSFSEPSKETNAIALNACRKSIEIEDFDLFFSALNFLAGKEEKRALLQSALEQLSPDAIAYQRERLQQKLAELDADETLIAL